METEREMYHELKKDFYKFLTQYMWTGIGFRLQYFFGPMLLYNQEMNR
jgi:hypothetical protein